jgi:hypothetical protein
MSERDLSGYDFLNITKDGFVPMSLQPASEAWLDDVGFQCMSRRMSSGYGITQSNIGLMRMICVRPYRILRK